VRVLFLPSWRENPYQELLATQLETRGVEVAHAGWKRLRHPLRIRRSGVDVVHLHSADRFHRARSGVRAIARALWALGSLLGLRVLGVRIVWTAHDLSAHDSRHPRVDAAFAFALARLAHTVIVHGETARHLLRERLRLHRDDRIAVIPHGPFDRYARPDVTRETARERLGLREDAVVFLFLGAVRAYKGVEDLLGAFARLEGRDARLLIRGRARDPELAERLRRSAAADPRVDLCLGYVPDDEIAALVAACDAVVAPYREVLTSGSVVLAMSLGRACIAPRLGGLPDVLDAESGWLYDPGQTDALLRALRDAFARRAELPERGRRARERAQRVDWPEIAEMTERVYRQH